VLQRIKALFEENQSLQRRLSESVGHQHEIEISDGAKIAALEEEVKNCKRALEAMLQKMEKTSRRADERVAVALTAQAAAVRAANKAAEKRIELARQ